MTSTKTTRLLPSGHLLLAGHFLQSCTSSQVASTELRRADNDACDLRPPPCDHKAAPIRKDPIRKDPATCSAKLSRNLLGIK